MNRIFPIVGAIAMIALPLNYVCILYRDLQHPELWDSHPELDPRLHAPLVAAVFIGGTCVVGYQILDWRRQARRSEQLHGLLAQSGRARERGDDAEADRLLAEFRKGYIALFGKPPERPCTR